MIDIRLDQHSHTPLYRQIAYQVRQLIATKRLKSGDHLPAIRQLAQHIGVNQNTVIWAYAGLRQEKIVVSRRQSGAFLRGKEHKCRQVPTEKGGTAAFTGP